MYFIGWHLLSFIQFSSLLLNHAIFPFGKFVCCLIIRDLGMRYLCILALKIKWALHKVLWVSILIFQAISNNGNGKFWNYHSPCHIRIADAYIKDRKITVWQSFAQGPSLSCWRFGFTLPLSLELGGGLPSFYNWQDWPFSSELQQCFLL